MTEVVVLQQSPSSHFPSSPSSSSSNSINAHIAIADHEESSLEERSTDQADQVPVLELLLSAFRRSLIAPCSVTEARNFPSSSSPSSSRMEIGWPSNVRHIAHVTFDRFNGFLGLPVEFEPEVPRRPPSASASVFGVSTESMQLSFDSRGNSVPTILLMMQRRLYARGGLEAEGIFRINGENSQEEYVRDQLNGGVVPDSVDVHCLAGLIKAWFRELPAGVLDSISPEQVMQSQTEEECARLVRMLPATEAALLDWAVNLMADVAEMEHVNKMNARNVAMVFAPNMTQMADPLTALMYAVQVMNFLKTLVTMTLEDRRDSLPETSARRLVGPSDEDDYENKSRTHHEEAEKGEVNDNGDNVFVGGDHPGFESSPRRSTEGGTSFLSSIENIILKENEGLEPPRTVSQGKKAAYKAGKKGGILGRVNSGKELAEAWR